MKKWYYKLLLFIYFGISVGFDSNSNVFIVMGEYNAANNGEIAKHSEFPNVRIWNWNILDWEIAHYPLNGASGQKGSIWGWFGQYFYETTQNVTYIIDIAQSDSVIYDWISISDEDDYSRYLDLNYSDINYLESNNHINEFSNHVNEFNDPIYSIKTPYTGKYYHLLRHSYDIALNYSANPTVLIQAGENDASGLPYTRIIDYTHYLSKIIDDSPSSVQWGIAISAYSPSNYWTRERFIRNCQQSVIEKYYPRSFVGPSSDKLCTTYRYDNYYFNLEGLQELGAIWNNSVIYKNKTSDMNGDYCNIRFIDWTIFAMYTLAFIIIVSMTLYAVLILQRNRRVYILMRNPNEYSGETEPLIVEQPEQYNSHNQLNPSSNKYNSGTIALSDNKLNPSQYTSNIYPSPYPITENTDTENTENTENTSIQT